MSKIVAWLCEQCVVVGLVAATFFALYVIAMLIGPYLSR